MLSFPLWRRSFHELFGERGSGEAAEMDVLPLPGPLPSAIGQPEPLPLSPAGDGEIDGHNPTTGQFVRGNRAGRGNPLARQAGRLRLALYRACAIDELADVIRNNREGEGRRTVAAARVLLERLLGPPVALDVATRIERLEVLLQEREPVQRLESRLEDFVAAAERLRRRSTLSL